MWRVDDTPEGCRDAKQARYRCAKDPNTLVDEGVTDIMLFRVLYGLSCGEVYWWLLDWTGAVYHMSFLAFFAGIGMVR